MAKRWSHHPGKRHEETITARENLVRGIMEFVNDYPWQWTPTHIDEWSLWLVSEKHLAPSTIRGYQSGLRLFSEFVVDGPYGWAVACEEAFGTHPDPTRGDEKLLSGGCDPGGYVDVGEFGCSAGICG